MKDLKFLYETTLKKQVEEKVTETRTENGESVDITRTKKSAKPVKIAILKPDRKLFKGAEMFYAKSLCEYLKAGLLPYSLVAKRYANDGGPLTEREKTRLKELRDESRALEKEFFAVIGDDQTKQEKKNELLIKINSVNSEVGAIQNAYSDIFDSTAEMKSRNDTIEWWSLYLIYTDEDGTGYKPLFGEGNHDERIAQLESYEDNAIPFYIETIKRLSYLISFWFTARETVTQIDFSTMEKLFVDTMSEYKVDEGGEDTKISESEPAKVVEPPTTDVAVVTAAAVAASASTA
jgi:hypothetical protein